MPIQRPIQRVIEYFFSGCGGEGVTLPCDLHLLARLRTRGAMPALLHASFTGDWLSTITILHLMQPKANMRLLLLHVLLLLL
jgi:hypothetical protein